MRRILSRAPRAAASLGAAALLAGLAGCFIHSDRVAIDAAHRGDADWLVGAWINEDDQRYTITREGVGLYRLSGELGEPEPEMRKGLAVLMGDCSADDGGEFPDGACAWTAEQLCENDETSLGDGPECVELVAALRDPAKQAALEPRKAEAVEGLRWVAEGLPWRDDVLFLAAPLQTTMLGEKWAAAQVRRIGSFGPYTDIGILSPQLLTGDLVLLKHGPDGEMIAWSTTVCVEGDGEAPVPAETALDLLADCADAIATGRLTPNSSEDEKFRPDPGRQP